MVLVEPPTAVPSRDQKVPMDGPRRAQFLEQPPLPPTDSFDNIDQLLEGKPATPVRSKNERWRFAPQSRTAAKSQANGETRRALHAVGRHPDNNQTRDAPSLNAPVEVMRVLDSAAADASVQTRSRGGSRLPLIALASCGIFVGVGAAIGVSAWILAARGPSSTEQSPAATRQRPNASRGGAIPVAIQPAVQSDDSVIPDLTADVASAAPAAEIEPEVVVNRVPVPDPQADDSKSVASAETFGGPEIDEHADVDPAREVNELAVVPPPVQLDAEGVVPSLDGNELANFARWLQATADPASGQPVDNASVQPSLPANLEPPDQATIDSPEPQSEAQMYPFRPSRSLPPPVNVDVRLAANISALRLDAVPLVEALRVVSSLTGVPISIDPDALGRRNRTAEVAVSVNVRQQSFRDVLGQLLDKTGLAIGSVGGQVIVTTPAEVDGQMVTMSHAIDDLVRGDEATAKAFADWIPKLFEVGSWQATSAAKTGEPADESVDPARLGRCELDDLTLRITHRDVVQFRILAFCEKLRVARGLPPKTPILTQRIELGSEGEPAALHHKTDLRIWRETELTEIVRQIESQVPIRILIDWSELYLAGWTPEDRFTLLSFDRPLETLLEEFLAPRGLGYRVVDRETLQITSAMAIDSAAIVQVWRLPKERAPTAIQSIVNRLGKQLFQPAGPGAVLLFEDALITSLPPAKQAVVADILK